MEILQWIRFSVGAIFLLLGMLTFFAEILGVFQLDYVINRMHAAAIGDTLGISLSLFGLILISGFNFTTLKLALVIIFLWFASPVASHLIARLEVTTNYDETKYGRMDK